MERSKRVHEKYEPEVELAERWPEWSVFDTTDLSRGEVFSVPFRSILMNSNGDREWAMAHVLAHLDLGHHLVAAGAFTEAHEADADLLASIRLDLLRWADCPTVEEPDQVDWDDIPVDGPPTIHL